MTAQRLKFAVGPAAALVAIAVVASSDSGADQERPLGVAAPQPTGSLVQADALGNTRIGGPDRTALAFYLIVGAGGLVATLATRFEPRTPAESRMMLRPAA